MKQFIVLGSTGSIGTSSLDVIAANPGQFAVAGLAVNASVDALCRQVETFRPKAVSVTDPAAAEETRKRVGARTTVYGGPEGIPSLLADVACDAVINGLVGSAGMIPTLKALEAGRDVLLANKETMVMAGRLVMETARRCGRRIVPIDSEMSAIYQCLKGESERVVARLVLTASGGPFVDMEAEHLARVTVAEALNHPTWNMGTKNTIDSATLMNKGLEVIEASMLFGIPGDRITVTVHRSSVAHSFVEFVDGSLLCQLSKPDMRLAIQYAMTDPDRLSSPYGGLDFSRPFTLGFEPPDFTRFPCLGLAFEALRRGGTASAALNGANEAAVNAFVAGEIGFMDIPNIIGVVMDTHRFIAEPSAADLIATDLAVKAKVQDIVSERSPGELTC